MSQTQTIKVNKGFTVNKAIIRHLIKSQCGSLSKAIEELCTNSLDAGASSIEVTLDKHHFKLVDNGTGFESEAEIEALFGDFGFDHTTNEQMAKHRKVGTFGLGRGQAFNFMRSRWTTNNYVMEVDLEDDISEAAYLFQQFDELLHKGCRIEGEFYEPLTLMDINNVERDLEDHLKYISGLKIILNGKQINIAPAEQKWDVETDDFYFKKSNHTNGVDVFNLGIYVETIRHYTMGVSGILVSKKNLKLNMARNSWLETECSLYKIAKKFLMEQGGQTVSRKKALKNEDREYLIRQMLAGEKDYWDVKTLKLIRGVNGKLYTLEQVSGYKAVTVATSENSQLGENLIRDRVAFVFSPISLGWFGINNTEELLRKMEQLASFNKEQGKPEHRGPQWFVNALKPVNFEDYNNMYDGDYMVIPTNDYTKQEKAAVSSFIGKLIKPICQAVGAAANNHISQRKILIGESEMAEAWTDGKEQIVIDRKVMTRHMNTGVDGAMYLIEVLLHEYCHDESSGEEHAHGEDFLKRYHDASFNLKRFNLALGLSKEYFSRCEKAGVPFKRSVASSIDQAEAKLSNLTEEN